MTKKIKENSIYSWNNVTIDDYFRIVEIWNDPEYSDTDRQVATLAIIEGVSEEELLSVPLTDMIERFSKLSFLNELHLIPKYRPTKIRIGDRTFSVLKNPSELSVSQFVDYQAYITKPFSESMPMLISIFIIPEGKKYNEGYDIVETQRFIRENMTFREAQSLLNFFLKMYLRLFEDSLRYLAKLNKKEKDQEKKKKLESQIAEIRTQMNSLIHIPGYALSNG